MSLCCDGKFNIFTVVESIWIHAFVVVLWLVVTYCVCCEREGGRRSSPQCVSVRRLSQPLLLFSLTLLLHCGTTRIKPTSPFWHQCQIPVKSWDCHFSLSQDAKWKCLRNKSWLRIYLITLQGKPGSHIWPRWVCFWWAAFKMENFTLSCAQCCNLKPRIIWDLFQIYSVATVLKVKLKKGRYTQKHAVLIINSGD